LVVRPSPLAEPGRAYWWAAASPEETVDELNRLLRDPEVRGIVALDGGRWVTSYLDRIDLDAIRADPKPIVGGSDISMLLLWLHGRTGLAGIHGDILRLFGEWVDLEPDRRAALGDAYRRVLTGERAKVELPLSAPERWHGGRAAGPLIGAMLNRLIRAVATGALTADRFDGAVLFWEEAWTSTATIWTDLHVLREAGILDRIAGMVVGTPVDIETTEGGPDDPRELVLDALGGRAIPVLGNADVGHAGPNVPLPLGVRAELDADALTLTLLELAAEPA
jgi:muramoyltetrapeptide carboxypeptidase